MTQLVSIPVIYFLILLQMTLSNKFTISNGYADLILVWITAVVVLTEVKNSWLWVLMAFLVNCFVSAVPWYSFIISYLIIYSLGVLINKRLWQSPLLSFFLVLIIGSIIYYSIIFLGLWIDGTSIKFMEAVTNIIFPSLILNLVIAFPIYLIVKDLLFSLYPLAEK
jgi:hypothetical protein